MTASIVRQYPYGLSYCGDTTVTIKTISRKKNKELIIINIEQAYQVMFVDFPDVLNIDELSALLEISRKTAYGLLKGKEIQHLKIGREYRIPKVNVLKYLMENNN